jgi:hypothetical protein
VAPLWLWGIRGKKSTPSIGWEVPVKSSQLASRELDEAQARENFFEFSNSIMVFSFLFALYKVFIVYMFRISILIDGLVKTGS